jgi:hypothetical protein
MVVKGISLGERFQFLPLPVVMLMPIFFVKLVHLKHF